MSRTGPGRPPLLAVALVSQAAVAYELLLMRLFSIIQYHHFAYMVISLALLGYGASGTALSLLRERLLDRFQTVYPACVALFGLGTVACFLLAQQLPFHPELVFWDVRHQLWLLLIYLLLALPFFFAALSTGLALSRYHDRVSRLYSMDLLGAGAGSLAVIVLLHLFFPARTLLLVASLAWLAGALAVLEMGGRRRLAAGFVAAALLVQLLPGQWTSLKISPYKELSQALRIKGARVVAERSSPLGLLTVVESPRVPWRQAPGMSMTTGMEPPEQLALFTDGGGISAINRSRGQPEELGYLDQLTSALPYHLAKPGNVLILGAGGGSEILQALYHRVERVGAVELNPQVVELVDGVFGRFSNGIYSDPRVQLHLAEARGFVAESREQYGLIQISLLDSFAAASAGLHALNESYLYTVEAMGEYHGHLKPGGYLVVSRWLRLPPRDSLKLFATALAALKAAGVQEPAESLLLIRSLQTTTLLVKNGPLNRAEIDRARSFCRQRCFDLCYYPGMGSEEANLYNVLQRPLFYQGAQALASDRGRLFMERYKFHLAPATDERPFFFHFLKWAPLAEIFSLRGKGGVSLLEWGYLVLLATLVQAVAASVALILVPLGFLRRQGKGDARPWRLTRVFLFFFGVGLAFLFLEIGFIQRFILFLHHPLYAVAVVLSGFLLFAGLGSLCSAHLAARYGSGKTVGLAVAGLTVCSLLYLAGLGPLLQALQGLPLTAKALLSLLLIAPMGVAMGMPFPQALGRLGELEAALVPWAWGVNGCASVLSAVLATLVAIHCGFSLVVVAALLLYLLAFLAFPWQSK